MALMIKMLDNERFEKYVLILLNILKSAHYTNRKDFREAIEGLGNGLFISEIIKKRRR